MKPAFLWVFVALLTASLLGGSEGVASAHLSAATTAASQRTARSHAGRRPRKKRKVRKKRRHPKNAQAGSFVG